MGEKPKYPRYYRQGKSWKLTEPEKLEMLGMREEGMLVDDIATRFDVSPSAVRYHTSFGIREKEIARNITRNKREGSKLLARQRYIKRLKRATSEYKQYKKEIVESGLCHDCHKKRNKSTYYCDRCLALRRNRGKKKK